MADNLQPQPRDERVRDVRGLLLALVAMTCGTLYVGWAFARHAGASAASWKWVALFTALVLLLALELVSLALSWSGVGRRLVSACVFLEARLARWRTAGVLLAVLLLSAFPALLLGGYGVHLMDLYPRLVLFGVLALAGGTVLRGVGVFGQWWEAVVAYGLAQGVVYRVVVFAPDVTTYPFSLGWSEGSRFYFASLFFARRIYGMDVPWPVLHPSRYLLQAVPFIVSGLPLWVHRLWQVLLWLGMTGLGAWLTVRRLGLTDAKRRWMYGVWAFLFFFQAPVYYHLMVCLLIVLWGFDSSRFMRSLAVVVAASLWAGISRVNWFPVPGLMAVLLYLLERPLGAGRGLVRYLAPPLTWLCAGLLAAFASGLGYARLSGNELERFGSSFTSDLLWYRLLPNATFGPGILKATLVLVLPGLVWAAVSAPRRWRGLHPLRLLGLAGVLTALLAEGLIVSVKIGGGGDLHNLDAFVAALLVTMAYALAGRVSPDRDAPLGAGRVRGLVIVAVLLAPAFWTARLGGPLAPRDHAAAWGTVEQIRQFLEPVVQRGGRVLFLGQRHLLTFGLVGEVPLEPEYERVFLMEMAMSRNEAYLRAFRGDLERHAFDVIVTSRLSVSPRGRGHRFGEEDDIWSQEVAAPVLQAYRPALVLEGTDMWLMVPAEEEVVPSVP